MPVGGDVLRAWRRARGWDVPETARRLRKAAKGAPVADHDALIRMIRRWEREGLRTERYELLYAAALELGADVLPAGPGGNGPSNESESPGVAGFQPVADAIDLGSWLEETNVGAGTLGYLADRTRRLAGDYTHEPPLAVLREAVEVQQRVTGLLRDGRQRVAQTRDLCLIGAEVFALLTLLCGDVGQYPAAEAYGHVGWICATESGSGLAAAFVLSAQAKTAQWRKRYADAAAKAWQGFGMCPPAGVRVLLACQEANAAQAAGDFTRARQALARAESAQDSATPGADDDGTTAWSCPPAREANYAAIVNLGCGDLDRSLQEARRADDAWAAGCPWVYGTWAQVRIGAAIAHVRNGEAEAAASEVGPVLSIGPEYRVVTITDRLLYVDRLLRGQRYHASRAAADLSEAIGDFCASSLRVKAIGPGGMTL